MYVQTCINKYKIKKKKNRFKVRAPMHIIAKKKFKFSFSKVNRLYLLTNICNYCSWDIFSMFRHTVDAENIFSIVGHLEFIQLLSSTFPCKLN